MLWNVKNRAAERGLKCVSSSFQADGRKIENRGSSGICDCRVIDNTLKLYTSALQGSKFTDKRDLTSNLTL